MDSTSYTYKCDINEDGYCKTSEQTDNRFYIKAYEDAKLISLTECNAKKLVRNRILLEQIRLIDIEYRSYEKNLTNRIDYKSFFAHLISLGLSTAATSVGGSAIISAIDTGIKGASNNFDSDILHGKTLNIIKNQMRNDMAFLSIQLKSNMSKDACEYPLEEALSDLSKYKQAGSFDNALTNLENATGAAADSLTKRDNTVSAGSANAVTAAEALRKQNEAK
jgi:hypothetical protein